MEVPVLHLLSISYDSTNNRIHLEGFDEESRTFADGIKEDNPEGYILKNDESASEVVLETLQALEGEFNQVYEVISISERKQMNENMMRNHVWDVWYRNKE